MKTKPLKICFDRVIPHNLAAERHLARRAAISAALRVTGHATPREALADLNPNRPGILGRTRMALIDSRKWEAGQTVRCKFLQGSKKQKDGVRRHAETWMDHANLKIKFVDSGDAEVRIAFISGDGSWSAVGTDALVESYFPKHQPTMNYGWLEDNTSDTEYRRVVLHEFGHAIGCVHEHQSPNVTLDWDEEAVYEYFSGSPNFWSKADIDHNVLRKYSPNGTTATLFDENSIMLYQFPAELFEDGEGTKHNTKLSTLDIQMIGEMYPNTQPAAVPAGGKQKNKKAKKAAAGRRRAMGAPAAAESPLAFVLRLVNETGYRDKNGNKASASSNIETWFKRIEKTDQSMNPPMPLTRTGKFVLQYTNHFPGVALSIGALTSGAFATPQALVDWAV